MLPERSRSEDCLSDLRLDRLLAEDLSSEDESSARAHLRACPVCRKRLDVLEGEHRAFAEAPPPRKVVSLNVARHRRWVAPGVLASVVAAAAAALLVYRSGVESPGTTRIKGSAISVSAYVRRGEHVGVLQAGGVAYPGDRLRFRYTADAPGYLALVSVDGAGAVSIYHPARAEPFRVNAGHDRLLDNAIELDDTLGEETVYAILCSVPVDPAELAARVERDRGATNLPPTCHVGLFTFTKEAPP